MSVAISPDPLLQLQDEANLNKYKTAGIVASKVLDLLVSECKPNKRVYDLCQLGDKKIIEELAKVHTDCRDKGIAFPTCISINSCAGFFSPLPNDETKIKEGDLAKIELGVHIDGFPALVCYTVVVNSGPPITDKRARVVHAVTEASREIINLMKPGHTNVEIAKVMQACAQKYNCNLPLIQIEELAPGTLSYQISRGVIDGMNEDHDEYVHQFIMPREGGAYDYGMFEVQFEEDEVYAIDILMSSGTGKLNRKEAPTTVMKKLPENKADLKLQSSKVAISSLPKNRFPVSLSNKMDARFRLGIKECISKKLVEEYPVLYEKEKEYIARVKFTVVVRKTPILVVARSASDQLKKVSLIDSSQKN